MGCVASVADVSVFVQTFLHISEMYLGENGPFKRSLLEAIIVSNTQTATIWLQSRALCGEAEPSKLYSELANF